MSEWRICFLYTRYYTINITSFHIFASTASGDIISIYAKMLKSTAYLRPCSVRQSKTLPLRQEGVPEGGGSVSLLQSPSLHRCFLKGRLIRFVAFGCYGSATCASTLCSHLNRNLLTFLYGGWLHHLSSPIQKCQNDVLYFIFPPVRPILNFAFCILNSPLYSF